MEDSPLIGDRAATPVGLAGQVRSHRSEATRKLTARPTESVRSERKSTVLVQSYSKGANVLSFSRFRSSINNIWQ